MKNNKIGITGYNGRLGSQLVKAGCTPLPCDITNEHSVKDAVTVASPEVIIHCAAYTNVDGAETEQEKALKVNMWGTRNVFESFPGRVIYISTDYIFDGKRGPYKELSKANPISFYGLTKWAGEEVCGAYDRGTIVRVSGLFGGDKPDFVYRTVRDLSLGKQDRYPANLRGSYAYVPHLAEALIWLANNEIEYPIINLVNKGVFSRYELALIVATTFKLDKKNVLAKQSYDGIAKRPKKGGLLVDFAEKVGCPIYSIFEGVEAYAKSISDPANL